MSETKLCISCKKEFPITLLKHDDYNFENYFCKKCYAYNIKCVICKKKAVTCLFNSNSNKRYFNDDDEFAFFEVSNTLEIYKYIKLSYNTNNLINDKYEKTICECFICRKFICTNCFNIISSSLYGYSDNTYILCKKCQEKYIDIFNKPSDIILFRKYKYEKIKRKKLEHKISYLETKLAVKDLLYILPSSVTNLICEYL